MKRFFKIVAPVVAAIAVALISSRAGLAQNAWYFFAIFVGVVLGLILEALPGSAIGLIGVTIVAAMAPWTLFTPAELSTPGLNAPGRAIEWALSGFSNSTVWLAFSAFMFGTAYDRTGLGRRIALSLVKLMGTQTLSRLRRDAVGCNPRAIYAVEHGAQRRHDFPNHPQSSALMRLSAQ